jgi:hypothetical protein
MMLRKILGAVLAIGLSSTAAMAVPIFDGTVTYTGTGANNCYVAGASYSAIYRPQIGAASKSGLVISTYRSGWGFTLPTSGQFNGTGSFVLVYVTQLATLVNRVGTFHLVQTPAAVTNATSSIQLSGDFTPTTGCKHVFKAVFIKRPGT